MAYTSDESGSFQLYVRAFPDTGGKWQVSSEGGQYPAWSRTAPELFFRSPDNRVMVTSYAAKGDSFLAERPRLWSEKRLADLGTTGILNFDLAPDGKRVAALISAEKAEGKQGQAQSHVILLENFFDELKRKVPIGK